MVPDLPSIVRGYNPQVLNAQPDTDPSGFEQQGFTAHEIHAVIEAVTDGIHRAYRAAPDAIVQRATREIQIFADGEHPQRPGAMATTQYDSNNEVNGDFQPIQTPRGIRVQTVSRAIRSASGIIFRRSPQEIRDHPGRLLQDAAHEGLHTLIDNGVAFSQSVNEMFVGGRERSVCPDSEMEQELDHWDGAAMHATCGLRCPADFGNIGHTTRDSKEIQYLAGPLALRSFTAGQIWKLLEQLVVFAHDKKRMATASDFQNICRQAVPAESDTILQSISFRLAQPGLQQFIFPGKDRSDVKVFTSEMIANPDYAYIRDGVMVTEYGRWRNIPPGQRMTFRPYVAGNPDPVIPASFELESHTILFFKELAEATERITDGRYRSTDIERINCSLGTTKHDLFPPPAHP